MLRGLGNRPAVLGAAVVISVAGMVGVTGAAGPSGAASRSHAVTVVPSSTPAFPGDAPDPDIVFNSGTYFAFTTGTALGNHIQALVDSSGHPASGYTSYTGKSYGSSALPVTPGWETPNTQTSPAVFSWGGQWLMYYDASTDGYPTGTSHDCISVATASALIPTYPVFTDDSSGPLLCQPQLGGSIDPSPFVDPATGLAYLIWKSNDGGSSQPAEIWSAQLDADGLGLASAPVELMTNDTVDYPWETTVENPDLVDSSGSYYLLFSGGQYDSAGYAEGYAVCNGPLGPCHQPQATPIISSYGSVSGPGGGSLFQDSNGNWWIDYAAWTSGCTNYSCGGSRELYVAPISLPSSTSTCVPPLSSSGYRFTAADGGVFDFGQLPFCGSTGNLTLNQPVVGMAATQDGGGYWLVAADGGIFNFGDAPFEGSAGAIHLNRPIVGMAATQDGGGYWLVAADGGIFNFGDAPFEGSAGAIHLNRPIVGMAATPDGRGYWLVASDGGIFTFGDAPFYGSTGNERLNRPIVGMAATPDGRGYWLVASDGGIFTFGDAPFYGSTGNERLNRPIVGMAATPDGRGYWLVASDGGIFTFGDAPFYGSTGNERLNQPIVGMATA